MPGSGFAARVNSRLRVFGLIRNDMIKFSREIVTIMKRQAQILIFSLIVAAGFILALAGCSPNDSPQVSAAPANTPSITIAGDEAKADPGGGFTMPPIAAEPLSIPPPEREFLNVQYAQAPGGLGLMLDLYLPRDEAHRGPWPVVVWIHGGGWAFGDKYPCPAQFLTRHGFAVASVNYRLAPLAIHPAQIQDCKAAVRWLRAHAAAYHLDPDRIGVVGQSAGAHLAALLGTSANERALEGRLGPLDVSSRVQAVCAVSGPMDLRPELLGEVALTDNARDLVSKFIGGPLDEKRKELAEASPATYASGDDPPFLLIHGERDSLVPVNQSRRMQDALARSGVKSQLQIDPNAGHVIELSTLESAISNFFTKTLAPAPTGQ